ncbi:MAG TPA: TIR domain-containing protein [Candidatus Nanopelagicaceae bacterium]|nr:TIR domain-containing protein [Candidatus Nanopelagicaceae bacterium]
MAKSTFISFHYAQDHWRVQQVVNMGAIQGQTIVSAQNWESVKRQGDQAIKNWIENEMKGKSAVVVLVGSQTAARPWVNYEIIKAWNDQRPLVGIRIHGLQDKNEKTDFSGANPFEKIKLDNGKTIADYVPLHTPSGAYSTQVYANIKTNITSWVENAYKRS